MRTVVVALLLGACATGTETATFNKDGSVTITVACRTLFAAHCDASFGGPLPSETPQAPLAVPQKAEYELTEYVLAQQSLNAPTLPLPIYMSMGSDHVSNTFVGFLGALVTGLPAILAPILASK
jgi:hypothetical protein